MKVLVEYFFQRFFAFGDLDVTMLLKFLSIQINSVMLRNLIVSLFFATKKFCYQYTIL